MKLKVSQIECTDEARGDKQHVVTCTFSLVGLMMKSGRSNPDLTNIEFKD